MSVPSRDDEPDDPRDTAGAQPSDGDARAREQAAWEAIIGAYGERPAWEDLAAEPDPQPRLHPDHPAGRGPLLRGDERDDPDDQDPEDRFVPPPTPPLPHVAPQRLVAWLGLFGVPALVLVLLLAQVRIPTWGGVLLMLWFVGGFGYLVASMRRDRGDDFDDGAVV